MGVMNGGNVMDMWAVGMREHGLLGDTIEVDADSRYDK